MSAVERLQAAIEKLENLKSESVAGPWMVGHHPDPDTDVEFVKDGDGRWAREIAVIYGGGDLKPHAELIVTLHRTIDAQLAILRTQLLDQRDREARRLPAWDVDTSLAEAILGGHR